MNKVSICLPGVSVKKSSINAGHKSLLVRRFGFSIDHSPNSLTVAWVRGSNVPTCTWNACDKSMMSGTFHSQVRFPRSV